MQKHLIVILIAILSALSASAGKIVPLSMRLDPNDMRGQTSKVRDRMGRPCALIKVRILYPGALFDGHIEAEDRTGEYFVYIEDGNKYLEIRFPGCEPLMVNFVDLMGESVKAPRTYELLIDNDALGYAPAAATSRDPGKNYAIISLTPTPADGATLSINGTTMAIKNGKASVMLDYGTYPYSIIAPGYHDYSGSLTVNKGDKTEVNVVLQSTSGHIIVTCPTPGSSIYINGEQVSTTSRWEGELLAMNYEVEARHPSYQSSSKVITIAEGERLSCELPELTPITGSLPVEVEPIGATVYIDGKEAGTTPCLLTDVLIGIHEISCKTDDGTFSVTVDVKEGNNAAITGEIATKQESEADNSIFTTVEEPPSFPGGQSALAEWIAKHLKYPSLAAENGIQGRVVVGFIVEKDGSLSNVHISRGKAPDLDKEALRVVKSLPKFKPGKNNGVPVRCTFTLPINFRLTGN